MLEDIAGSVIDLGRGVKASVGQAVEMRNAGIGGLEAQDALARNGLCVFDNDDPGEGRPIGDYLFIAHAIVIRLLLKDTAWARQNIDQILTRIPGAVRTRRRFAGQNIRGVLIPLETFTQSKKSGF